MSTIKRFEDIEAWGEARSLSKEINKITRSSKFFDDYSLVSQIRRSSGSIMDNIAEGFEREEKKEFIHFLSIAKGSAGEVRSQLYRAYDADYIVEHQFIQLQTKTVLISKKLSGFMKYLRSTSFAGKKFDYNLKPQTLNLKLKPRSAAHSLPTSQPFLPD
ncbi:MAG: four helix bundle protein [Bacteroidetes bacterium]|nr:four helix bundle protein [Bacteroidota bacterium]